MAFICWIGGIGRHNALKQRFWKQSMSSILISSTNIHLAYYRRKTSFLTSHYPYSSTLPHFDYLLSFQNITFWIVASLLIELILEGSIMKDYFYAIAVEDQIMGIDSDLGVYFEEPTIKNISECSIFPDRKDAEHFLRYCK